MLCWRCSSEVLIDADLTASLMSCRGVLGLFFWKNSRSQIEIFEYFAFMPKSQNICVYDSRGIRTTLKGKLTKSPASVKQLKKTLTEINNY